MRKQAISIALVLSGLVVLAGVLTDWRIASGYVMGAAISALLYWRTTMFCDQVLDQQAAGKIGLIGHFLFNYLLMALPLLIAALVPEVFNIFAAAGGLFLMKVVLILDSVLERREKDG